MAPPASPTPDPAPASARVADRPDAPLRGDVSGAATPLSWQELVAARRLAAGRWPSAFRLPLVHRPTDILYGLVSGRERILDVGAGDSERRRRIAAKRPDAAYVAVDTDPASGADHARIEDAPGEFDIAVFFEVLEHVRPEEAVSMLRSAHGKLRKGGAVVVSVPAIHTPGRQFRDCTHVTPWSHDDLGAALILAGFDLEAMHRTYPGTLLGRLVRRSLLGPIGRVFGLDYAHSVVVTGRRG